MNPPMRMPGWFLLLLCLATHSLIGAEPSPAKPSESAPPAAPAQAAASAKATTPTPDRAAVRQALDAYLDQRWLPADAARESTQKLIRQITEARVELAEVEQWLRDGRAQYPPPPPTGQLLLLKGLTCDHVDYTSAFFLYVPESYASARATSLLLIGHGGNSAMSFDYATQAALGGLVPWIPVAAAENIVLAAPLTERGWGSIGNSLLLSLISGLQRMLHLDPDRIYVTGHSMGGHLTWRSGIGLSDRWGAVLPMSGGYDYVETRDVFRLVNVPGYATFGKEEPYNINTFNRKIAAWMSAHGYDWISVEKPGGHEIYADELPKAARFMREHPRHLYRPKVYAAGGKKVDTDQPGENEKWPVKHQWRPERPIPQGMCHWVRLFNLPEDTPPEAASQRVWAEQLGENRIRITAQHARRMRIYLHPRLVDFSRPLTITVNGVAAFQGKVEPRLETLLELAREFDDRGRLFHAAVDLEVASDALDMPEPRQ